MRLRVLLCATLIGACGSDERNDKTTAAPETAATTSETRGDGSADTTIAEQSVLKLEDFPSGWKRLGRAGENESCDSVAAAKAIATAHRAGERFGQEALQSESAVYVFADQASAQKGYEQLASAETPACLADAMIQGIGSEPNVTLGKPRITSVPVDAAVDAAEGARVRTSFTGGGVKGEIDADLVFARSGRGVVMLAFVNAFAPFDGTLRGQLTQVAVSRLAKALDAS
jgi:hypothetical protein